MKTRSYGRTVYSEYIKGTTMNHSLQARFDYQDGCLGISQKEVPDGPIDRVLLSPAQIRKLLAFLKANARS